MRENVRDRARLEHIDKAIDILLTSRTKYTTDEMEADPIVFFGIVKHIEIIGEAAYMLTNDFKEAHREVEWNVIVAMRHVLVHGYYAIRPQQVWEPSTTTCPS